MDAIEILLDVFALLRHWRVLLCLLISALGAFELVQLLPWFDGLQGGVMALLGIVPGCIWQARQAPSDHSPSRAITNRFVAALCAFFVGFVWGGASSTRPESAIAGGMLLLLSLLVWYYHEVIARKRMTPRRAGAYGAICATSYLLMIGVSHHVF